MFSAITSHLTFNLLSDTINYVFQPCFPGWNQLLLILISAWERKLTCHRILPGQEIWRSPCLTYPQLFFVNPMVL